MQWHRTLVENAPSFPSGSDWCNHGSFVCRMGWCDAYALNVLPDRDDPSGSVLRLGSPIEQITTRRALRRRLRQMRLRRMPRFALTSPMCRIWASQPGHLVAVAVIPKTICEDSNRVFFHFYRLDKVGTWSHKHGDEIARDVDKQMERIEDPVKADRGDFTELLGYWWVPQRKLRW